MKHPFSTFLACGLFLFCGSSLSANPTLAPSPLTLALPIAIGTAPTGVQDSLPHGRHQVSSFRNGASTEFIVEDGEIVMLKVDGKEIPESEYDQHRGDVESMLGGGPATRKQSDNFTFDIIRDMNGIDLQNEHLERYFEEQGEQWEQMGERMAERFEKMFEFDKEGGVFRFDFDGNNSRAFEFNLDSMLRANPNGLRLNEQTFDLEEMIREKEGRARTAEEEIDDLSTMIEQMERRKTAAEERLEATEEAAKFTMNGFNFREYLENLRAEGIIEPGLIRSFEFTHKSLKVNGQKANDEVHAQMLRDYREKVNIGSKFSYENDNLDW
ncbi:hypothetical protein [Neolewinella antarctica]|uniref:Uncharacterized protein n=1 Tax=Neolewinella antarctica TaxID=442734 RepID=A0ABX0XBR0_9BACT|nr:hypothetical protein [Neolewinella antarctica]NJC26368.1 hypothetical protein [Neolewinella antarctica]